MVNQLTMSALPLLLFCLSIVSGLPLVTQNENLVSDTVQSEPVQTNVTTLPEGYVKFSQFATAYKISDEELAWDDAREQCISEGGHLAIIDSTEKITAVLGLKELTESVYVGFHENVNNRGEWLRVDTGLPVTSIPWADENPDGTGPCASLAYDGAGIWDVTCRYTRKYVCEISL